MNEYDEKEGECAVTGIIEAATLREVAASGRTGSVLAELALWLARVIDSQPVDVPAAAAGKLSQELRTTIRAMNGIDESDDVKIKTLFEMFQRQGPGPGKARAKS